MGNRAVITASESKTKGVGIYLHWNGGPESIAAFLQVCKDREYRSPGSDQSYAMARLTGVIHEFFDGGLSVGLGDISNLDTDNFDNGVYVIGGDWEVTGRWGEGSRQNDCNPETFDGFQKEYLEEIPNDFKERDLVLLKHKQENCEHSLIGDKCHRCNLPKAEMEAA